MPANSIAEKVREDDEIEDPLMQFSVVQELSKDMANGRIDTI